MTDNTEEVDLQGALKGLELIPYGVYIVTTGGGVLESGAFTACWMMQISFDPLLVALAVDKVGHSHMLLEENGNFAVNFLHQSQTQIAARMATPHTYSPFKMNAFSWGEGLTGVPILKDSLGHIECIINDQTTIAGDHTLFIGQVIDGNQVRRDTVLTLEKSGLRYK
jgi:flavin reductase (DIM6/NTAB) family NADH-FMN oxidoreductase RutF